MGESCLRAGYANDKSSVWNKAQETLQVQRI
jgi:hypothetical protein